MAANFTWGRWEEKWSNGRFQCVFVEANPAADGMIHATGLYRAMPGESLDDLDTYEDQVADRTIITTDKNGGLLVENEFAELLGTLPAFLQAAVNRLRSLANREAPQSAAKRSKAIHLRSTC